MIDEAMSPLRRRMIEDMTIRKLAPKTQHDYVQRIKNFAVFLGRSPDTATFEDVRRYQLHLAASCVGVSTLNQAVSTLRFFFRVTLKRHDIVEYTHFVSRAAQATGGSQSRGGGARLLDACSGPADPRRIADRGHHRPGSGVQICRSSAAVPAGPDLCSPGHRSRSFDTGGLGGTSRLAPAPAARASARQAQAEIKTVCRRDDDAGARSRPRPHQDRPALGLCR